MHRRGYANVFAFDPCPRGRQRRSRTVGPLPGPGFGPEAQPPRNHQTRRPRARRATAAGAAALQAITGRAVRESRTVLPSDGRPKAADQSYAPRAGPRAPIFIQEAGRATRARSAPPDSCLFLCRPSSIYRSIALSIELSIDLSRSHIHGGCSSLVRRLRPRVGCSCLARRPSSFLPRSSSAAAARTWRWIRPRAPPASTRRVVKPRATPQLTAHILSRGSPSAMFIQVAGRATRALTAPRPAPVFFVYRPAAAPRLVRPRAPPAPAEVTTFRATPSVNSRRPAHPVRPTHSVTTFCPASARSARSRATARVPEAARSPLGSTPMILTQVHLRKPCYDFYFLEVTKFVSLSASRRDARKRRVPRAVREPH